MWISRSEIYEMFKSIIAEVGVGVCVGAAGGSEVPEEPRWPSE